MPVILDPDGYDLWLDPGMRNVTLASELLRPYTVCRPRHGIGTRWSLSCGSWRARRWI